MKDLSVIINSIQRNKILDEDKATVCAAIQHYYKYLLSVGAVRAVKPSLSKEDVIKKPLSKMNKTELMAEIEELGISTIDPEMTNKQLIELINQER